MSVSRVGMGVVARRDIRREQPRRRRLGLMLLLSIVVGGAAGVVGFIVIWMPTLFGSFQDTHSTPPQIAANVLFPPAAPIQQTINVTDPPPVYVAPHRDAGGGGGSSGSGGSGGSGGGGGDDNGAGGVDN